MKKRYQHDWAMDGEKKVNKFSFKPEFRQFRRKNNTLVQAMYAMYLSGKSLAEVADVYKKTRQTVHQLFRVRGFKLRAKQLKGLQIMDGIKFTLAKGGYLRGTHPDGRRILMHHYVWEKHHGPIPPKHVIRIMNGNLQDCRIENLELMSLSQWNKIFSPHLNQFTAPNGSRCQKGDRIKKECEARWARAMAIG
jgi:hypothetical protein